MVTGYVIRDTNTLKYEYCDIASQARLSNTLMKEAGERLLSKLDTAPEVGSWPCSSLVSSCGNARWSVQPRLQRVCGLPGCVWGGGTHCHTPHCHVVVRCAASGQVCEAGITSCV